MKKDVVRTGVAFLAMAYRGGKAFHWCLLLADNVDLKTSTVKLRSGER